jgi:quercetin dioxygenase-like cupin family protein
MAVLAVKRLPPWDDTRMSEHYTFFTDLAAEAAPVGRGIHSQTLSKADGVEVVLFTLAAGEELSEHTSARPAIVHVLRGTGRLVVAGDEHAIAPGAWVRMPARTQHAIVAESELVFALYLLPRAEPA